MKREFRIRKHAEFLQIMRSGHFKKSPSFLLYWKTRSEGSSRLGINVSKKNGNAVIRNRIKRQIRAIIAANYDLEIPVDAVIVARTSYDVAKFSDNQKELGKLLSMMGEKHIEKA